LSTQIAEMKGKFDGYEAQRKEREKRYEEFTKHISRFFESQEKRREEETEKQNKQLDKFSNLIQAFSRTIYGAKTRGMIGEEILREYLSPAIESGIIITNLKTEGGEVEFAWSLNDEKNIPIDSKFPDVMDQISLLDEEDITQSEKSSIRREIINKAKKEIERVRKYQNCIKTIDKCILTVPEAIIEVAPEIITLGSEKNVFVCSYKQVFFIGFMLSEEYDRIMEEGDVGTLKSTNKKLIQILADISKYTETIERQANSVIKYNQKIKGKVSKGQRFDLTGSFLDLDEDDENEEF
ncbi:MAG: DNA recombination protein RmuC, partial [Candidatus Lokiarchaeota archaeon]|nr:DNA recombination protein RmuC [Candidatus Lokiarchaeota archaeon]